MKYFQHTIIVISVCFLAMNSVESTGYKGVSMHERGVTPVLNTHSGTLVVDSQTATGYFVMNHLVPTEEIEVGKLNGKQVTLQGAGTAWNATVASLLLFFDNRNEMFQAITTWAGEGQSKATLSPQKGAQPKFIKLTALANGL